ncbi:MAG: hypothetical protein KC482_05210 [Dehalococcoidia bacterium]|nr:hypothetical protein [Dehalococcoidia bacterium]MCA9852984.1 hypothetical protein [Dehalococcoidia bacterium]
MTNVGANMLRSVASCAFVLVLLMSVDGCGESPREGRLPQDRRESEYEFQRELLADGVVTASELEQAVLANMACLDRKGIRHSKPIYDESNAPPVWNYDVGPVPTEQIGPDGSPTEADKCYEEFQQDVDSAWVLQEQPSEAEMQEREREASLHTGGRDRGR